MGWALSRFKLILVGNMSILWLFSGQFNKKGKVPHLLFNSVYAPTFLSTFRHRIFWFLYISLLDTIVFSSFLKAKYILLDAQASIQLTSLTVKYCEMIGQINFAFNATVINISFNRLLKQNQHIWLLFVLMYITYCITHCYIHIKFRPAFLSIWPSDSFQIFENHSFPS